MNWTDVAIGAGIGLGTYALVRLFTPYYGSFWTMGVQARTFEELQGYLHGLIRGSGSRSNAIKNLEAWRDYWQRYAPKWSKWIIDYWYKYGLKMIDKIYK